MTPYYQSPDGKITLYLGDCLDVFPALSGLSCIVADTPSGTGFMGRKWDKARQQADNARRRGMTHHEKHLDDRAQWVAYWAERIAIAKAACIPDHVSFFWSLPRTQGWTQTAVENSGYFIKDTLTTINGQGWPKEKGVLRPCKEEWIIGRSGAGLMDREACRVERGGESTNGGAYSPNNGRRSMFGLGDTGHEFVQPPGSLPCNIALGHCGGDGGLQCRAVGVRKVKGEKPRDLDQSKLGYGRTNRSPSMGRTVGGNDDGTESLPAYECRVACRSCGNEWLALSGGEAPRCQCGAWGEWACPVAEVDSSGIAKSGAFNGERSGVGYGSNAQGTSPGAGYEANEGGQSRYFNRLDSLDASLAYFAKCPSGERHMGCDELYWKVAKKDPFGFVQVTREEWKALDPGMRADGNSHPTTKRVSAMRHIHRLAGSTRPGWHVGDPCVGSGTGALAAILDGVRYTGTEICEQALVIAVARIKFLYGLSHEAFRAMRDEEAIPVANQQAPTGQSAFSW